jgi:cephalosporin hydroxylase
MQLDFKLTRDWTSYHYGLWDDFAPANILEIGSFEGRSALYWAQKPTTVSITCVDTWGGSEEHLDIDFKLAEQYFDYNISFFPFITKIKQQSSIALAALITKGIQYDWIYIDGSHKAHDVLTDAVMSFQLLKVGGHILFDDYLFYDSYRFDDWGVTKKPDKLTSYPKTAIDSFINIFYDQLQIIHINRQVIVEKLQ